MAMGVNAAPLVTFYGGGTNSQSLFVSFSEDFTVQVKPGKTVSSYDWGITLSNSIARDIFTSTYAQASSVNLITSQGVVLQTSNGATPITLTNPIFNFIKQNPANYPLTLSFMDANDRLFANGGSVTFSKGIIEIENNPRALTDPGNFLSQGFYVLNQQNASFELNLNNIMGTSESAPGFNLANLQVVPEPSTYALSGLGALGLVIAYRRRSA